MPRKRGLVPLLLSLSLTGAGGCLYGFSGGGLPPGIRTVAVLPFENMTAEPTLTQEITQAVREAVESRLGLRPAGEEQADANRFFLLMPGKFVGERRNPQDVID